MEVSQKDTIRKAAEHLKSCGIDIDGMIAKLRVKKIITPKQMAILLETKNRDQKLDAFVSYMQRKSSAAFEVFREWFQATVDQMNYKIMFGTEEEKKEFELTEEEEDEEEESEEDESDVEHSQPPLKKMKSGVSATYAGASGASVAKKSKMTLSSTSAVIEDADSGKEANEKLPKSKGKGKGKGKKVNALIQETINRIEATSPEQSTHFDGACLDGEDTIWDFLKADRMTSFTPSNKNQLYRIHIGKQIFATAGEFRGKFYFHVRRYKGDKMYPGLGVALSSDNFKKFLLHQEEIKEALKHPRWGETSFEMRLDDVKVSVVDDKLDIRKMINLKELTKIDEEVFSRSGVRISEWQFERLLAVGRHLPEIVPHWAE